MSLGGRHKAGSRDVKTRAPDVCRSSPLGDTKAVECGRGKEGRWLPLAEVNAKTAPAKKRKEKEKKQRKEKIEKKKRKGIKKKKEDGSCQV